MIVRTRCEIATSAAIVSGSSVNLAFPGSSRNWKNMGVKKVVKTNSLTPIPPGLMIMTNPSVIESATTIT